MRCDNCGETVRVQKSLQRGKADVPDDCPTCGEELQRENHTRLEKA